MAEVFVVVRDVMPAATDPAVRLADVLVTPAEGPGGEQAGSLLAAFPGLSLVVLTAPGVPVTIYPRSGDGAVPGCRVRTAVLPARGGAERTRGRTGRVGFPPVKKPGPA